MNLFITGTDTDAGKTTVSSWVCSKIKHATYWKPVQTGDDSDASMVKVFAPHAEIIPEAYKLKAPLSAFDAAKKEGVNIDLDKLLSPIMGPKSVSFENSQNPQKPIIIEGAGGVFVPISDGFLMIDLIKRTNSGALVVVRSKLGLINHILLTIFALRSREIPIVGIIVCGDLEDTLKDTIEQFAETKILAILPTISKSISRSAIKSATESAHNTVAGVKFDSGGAAEGGCKSHRNESIIQPDYRTDFQSFANLFESTPLPAEILEILE